MPGTATVTLEPDGLLLVVKGVPAQVCGNCGEEYVDVGTTQALLESAREAARSGVEFQLRRHIRPM